MIPSDGYDDSDGCWHPMMPFDGLPDDKWVCPDCEHTFTATMIQYTGDKVKNEVLEWSEDIQQ